MLEKILNILRRIAHTLSIPRIGVSDILEIFILAIAIYALFLWVQKTKAWSVLKGVVVLVLFLFIAWIMNMSVILWIAQNLISVGAIAMVILFQPELRKLLERIGRTGFRDGFFSRLMNKGEIIQEFSDETKNAIVTACVSMSKVKTGALIVIEGRESLDEYSHTGIMLNSMISSQLLINIFEHNTPLHDGAVTIHHDKIIAATCYLPLTSSDTVSKELGTRHRAALGVSEARDCVAIVVSEETGKISIAEGGYLSRDVQVGELQSLLTRRQNKQVSEGKMRRWTTRLKKLGGTKNE